MNNTGKNTFAIAALLSLVCVMGCGLIGEDKIENDVINADFRNLELPVTEGTSKIWLFGVDQGRCFSVLESKFSGDNAELTVGVASHYESGLAILPGIYTAFGKVQMNYKRDGKSWKLQTAESKELVEKRIPVDELDKFLEIAAPLCRSYRAKL